MGRRRRRRRREEDKDTARPAFRATFSFIEIDVLHPGGRRVDF